MMNTMLPPDDPTLRATVRVPPPRKLSPERKLANRLRALAGRLEAGDLTTDEALGILESAELARRVGR